MSTDFCRLIEIGIMIALNVKCRSNDISRLVNTCYAPGIFNNVSSHLTSKPLFFVHVVTKFEFNLLLTGD